MIYSLRHVSEATLQDRWAAKLQGSTYFSHLFSYLLKVTITPDLFSERAKQIMLIDNHQQLECCC